MAWAVTARHSGTSGASAVQSQATNSVAPTANSLLLAFAGVERDLHTVAESWAITGGGTWTLIETSASFAFNGTPDFNVRATLQRLAVGGSPSAHTITADAWSGVEDGYYSVLACDVTGHDTGNPVIQSKTGGATEGGGDTESTAVTFDTALTNGSLVVVGIAAGNDAAGAFTAPTIGGQAMTQLHNLTDTFCHAGLWYRVITGAESDRTVTCSDLGEDVGASAWVMVELRAASSGTAMDLSSAAGSGAAQALSLSKAAGLGSAAGSGTAQALSVGKAAGLGAATGSGTAQPLTASKALALDAAAGSGTPQPMTFTKGLTLGTATGSGAAQPLSMTGDVPMSLGPAAGTGTPQPMTFSKGLPLGVATGAGAPAGIGADKSLALAQAAGAGAAQALTPGKALSLQNATGSGAAQAAGFTAAGSMALGTAAGTGAPQPMTFSKNLALSPAAGSGAIQAVALAKALELAAATGVGTVQVLSNGKALPFGAAQGAGAPQALSLSGAYDAPTDWTISTRVAATVDPRSQAFTARTRHMSYTAITREHDE